jgi:hypothetical protein
MMEVMIAVVVVVVNVGAVVWNRHSATTTIVSVQFHEPDRPVGRGVDGSAVGVRMTRRGASFRAGREPVRRSTAA